MRRHQGDDRARPQADAGHRGRRGGARRRRARRGVRVAARQALPAAALLAVAALAAGCGGGTGEEGKSGARAAAEQYVQALKDGDGNAACELLTEGAVAQLEDEAGAACPRALSAAFGAARGAQLERLEVVEVNASDDLATATIRGGPNGKVTSQLMREQGEWRLASPGG